MLNRANTRNVFQRVWPGSEAVTLYVRVAPGSTFSPTGGYSLARARRKPDTRSDGMPALAEQELEWGVWQADLDAAGAPAPKVNDVIQDGDGVRWSVDRVSRHLFGNHFRCQCVRER